MQHEMPEIQSLARKLTAHDESEDKLSETTVLTICRTAQKLRLPLVNLMGNGGFRVLLSRALVLASAEVSWLTALRVRTNGNLEELEALHIQLAKLTPAELFEGKVVLLAKLLELLVDFVGHGLTLRVVQEVWPNARFGNDV